MKACGSGARRSRPTSAPGTRSRGNPDRGRCRTGCGEDARRSAAGDRPNQAQQTVLHADALDVDARLAKSRYGPVGRRARARDRARTPKRVPRPRSTTPFRVLGMPEDDAGGLTLEDARQRCFCRAGREIRQAHLKAEQAGNYRRTRQGRVPPGPEPVAALHGVQQLRCYSPT